MVVVGASNRNAITSSVMAVLRCVEILWGVLGIMAPLVIVVCVIVSSLLIFISSLSYCLVIWLPIGIYRGFLAKVGFVLNSLGIQKAQRTFKFSGLEIVLFCWMAGLKHLRDLKINLDLPLMWLPSRISPCEVEVLKSSIKNLENVEIL